MNMNNVKSWLANLYYPILLILVISYGIFSVTALKNIPENPNVATIIAGMIGGFGTMIAVLISTIHTSKIQEENKEETRKIQADNKKENRKAQDIEKKSRLIKERKEFGDDIAVLIGRYITDISSFYFSDISGNYLSRLIDEAKITGNIDLYNKIKTESIKFTILNTRKISVECFFILKIKLKDIKLAESLLVKLDLIHDEVYKQNEYLIGRKEWNSHIQELQDLTIKFIDDYVNEVDSLSSYGD